MWLLFFFGGGGGEGGGGITGSFFLVQQALCTLEGENYKNLKKGSK